MGRRKSIEEAESDLAIRKARKKLRETGAAGRKSLEDMITAHKRKFKL